MFTYRIFIGKFLFAVFWLFEIFEKYRDYKVLVFFSADLYFFLKNIVTD